MTDKGIPRWAIRLREERTRRLWSQKVMAVRLRDAADEETQAVLPAIESIQRYVRDYESGKHFPGDLYAALYCRALGLTHDTLFGTPPSTETHVPHSARVPSRHDARSLISWITATNISDAGIDNIVQAAAMFSEAHTQRPPAQLLADVVRIHQQVHNLLQEGKQRLRQTRNLYRLDADLLAHASLLLGDLHFDKSAAEYGSAAMLYAREADSSPAIAFSVQAKTERWRLRFADSADLARRGFECSPPTTIRVLLASQEANAAALLGDLRRAHAALRRAEDAADGPIAPDSGVSAWSCPRPRQALYAMSVATQAGDPDAALQAADMADSAWASGDPWAAGVWAQVRLGAGIAHIMKGDLDGARKEFTPVLAVAPEFRISTITGYTSHMGRLLQQRRFRHSAAATELRQQIQEFNSAALSALRITSEGD
jgi:hypothetical protein